MRDARASAQQKGAGNGPFFSRRKLGVDQAAVVCWIHFDKSPFGAAPTFWPASLPPLNSIKVGIERMPNCEAMPGFSSTLTLAILTLPCISVAISSSAGPIIRQGPHHSAQKSTTTGSDALRTSCSKLVSVTFMVAMHHLFDFARLCPPIVGGT